MAHTHQTMPVIFVGHGSPMNAIEDSPYSEAWIRIAQSIPKPKAIICISAHWQTDGVSVTGIALPKTIHDFYGFPDELNRIVYPAPGSPDLAKQVLDGLSHDTDVTLDSNWGLDHGTWSVLCRMYPKADIPVVQLSLDRTKGVSQHAKLAKMLDRFRDKGVLVMGSGNIVHNLARIEWEADAYPWAVEFDAYIADAILKRDTERIIHYENAGESSRYAVPTNEHYLPLLYTYSLSRKSEKPEFFAEGITLGSLSMRSVIWR